MYEAYFGLDRSPFNITPDTSLFFDGGQRGDILGALAYAVHRGEGIIKVVGEVGSGKTMLCRMLQQELPEDVEIIYIANPSVSPKDILFVIASELKFEVDRDASKHELVGLLQNYLLEKHEENQQVVLFVEEAQGMPLETLEEIRLLSNLETDRHKLLQIILFGQPELDINLEQNSIRQLRERITHDFNLSPLGADEIHRYLDFRLREVGYTGPELISKQLAETMRKHSSGLLRRINILADKMLLSAYAEDTHTVSKQHLMNAVKDSGFAELPSYSRNAGSGDRWRMVALAMGVLVVILLWGNYNGWMSQAALNDVAEEDPSGQSNASDMAVIEKTSPPAPPPASEQSINMQASKDAVQPDPITTDEQVSSVDEAPNLDEVVAQAMPLPEAAEPEAVVDTAQAVETQQDYAGDKMLHGSKKSEQSEGKLDTVSDAQSVTTASSGSLGNNHSHWLTSKLRQSKEWLRSANGKGVSIQMLTRKAAAADELIEYLQTEWPLDLRKTYVYENEINESRFYSVFYDVYPTVSEGQLKIKQLPDSITTNVPYLQSIYRMQQAFL